MYKGIQISFQNYPPRVKISRPEELISHEQFIISTRNPKKGIRAIFGEITVADLSGDKTLKSELKQNHHYYFTARPVRPSYHINSPDKNIQAIGYIPEYNSKQMINYKIEAHPYLQKAIAVYIKIADCDRKWVGKVTHLKQLTK